MKIKYTTTAKTRDLILAKEKPANIRWPEPFKEGEILLDDLAFTLIRDKTKYLRPYVRLSSDSQLEVIGNVPFFQGIGKAGIEEIYIDLLCEDQTELKKATILFSNSTPIPLPKPITSLRQFLFYSGEIPAISTDEIRARWPLIEQIEVDYLNQNVNFTMRCESIEAPIETEVGFLDRYAVNRLRSINGIIKPAKRYEKYFKSH